MNQQRSTSQSVSTPFNVFDSSLPLCCDRLTQALACAPETEAETVVSRCNESRAPSSTVHHLRDDAITALKAE